MNSIVPSAVALGTLLPAAVFAESPIPISECEFGQSYGPTVWYEDHRDIGAGYVMYEMRGDDGRGGHVYVASCFSGSTLTVDYTGYDAQDVEAFVLAAAASPERVTLSDLREHFSSLGLWTNLNMQDLEHCPCAAFYPEAKGEKGNWQLRYGHP